MVALSEDARLDILERDVRLLWENLHVLSSWLLKYQTERGKVDDHFISCCEAMMSATQLVLQKIRDAESD